MVQNLARLILNHLVISKVVEKLKTLFFLEICQTGPVTNSLHCSRFLNVTQRSRCVTSKKRLREEDDVTNLGGHGTLRYCGIELFFSSGISVILIFNVWYCVITQPCGMRFFILLANDIW